MGTRFLPVREADLDLWLGNFSAKLSAAPASYGITAADAAGVAAAVAAWHAAFVTAAAPATRTSPAVAEKRAQKIAVTAVVRRCAARIRANASVGDDLKIGLGLVLRNPRGTIIPPPASVPVLALRRSDPGAHALLAMDGSSERAGKPDRVAALVVFRAVAEGPVRRPEEGAYLGLFTRPRFASNFTAADRGKTATYFARWANAKGEPGPWSNALSVAIAA